MKKKIFSLAIAVSMLSASASVMAPTPANAALGIVTGNGPLFVIGAVMAALDSSVFISCAGSPHFQACHQATFVGVPGLIGLILLDGSKNQSVPFAAISAQDAARLGVTDGAAIDAYNHELDEINAVRADILSDVMIRANGGEQVKGADVHAAWQNARAQGLISPAAFVVVEKISAEAAAALK